MLSIAWAGHDLTLLSDRALLLPACATLIVADVHLGKPAAFRRAGVPVPEGTTAADLARLDALLDASEARRLIVLGDLLHARDAREPELIERVARWREARPRLDVVLVRGNHDRRAGDPPQDWRVETVDALEPAPGLLCLHEPEAAPGRSVLAGHLHPVVAMRAPGCTPMRAACFWFAPGLATLPAFGSFTGGHVVRPGRGDRVFALGQGEVIEVSAIWATPPRPGRGAL